MHDFIDFVYLGVYAVIFLVVAWTSITAVFGGIYGFWYIYRYVLLLVFTPSFVAVFLLSFIFRRAFLDIYNSFEPLDYLHTLTSFALMILTLAFVMTWLITFCALWFPGILYGSTEDLPDITVEDPTNPIHGDYFDGVDFREVKRSPEGHVFITPKIFRLVLDLGGWWGMRSKEYNYGNRGWGERLTVFVVAKDEEYHIRMVDEDDEETNKNK